MSILGIVFLSIVTLMLIEMLVHIIIFAKTGTGGFDEAPFSVYAELIRKSRSGTN